MSNLLALSVEHHNEYGKTHNSWLVESVAITNHQLVLHYQSSRVSGFTVGKIRVVTDGGAVLQEINPRFGRIGYTNRISLTNFEDMEFLTVAMDIGKDIRLPTLIRSGKKYYMSLGNAYLCNTKNGVVVEMGVSFDNDLANCVIAPLTLEEHIAAITNRLEKECNVLSIQSAGYSEPGSPLKDWKPFTYNSLTGGFAILPSNIVEHFFPDRTLTH